VDREAYVEQVLAVVESIPPGRVMSYGAVADAVGVGGPRQVGQVLARYGGPVPWWRVVRADGSPPAGHAGAAQAHHRRERTPLRTRTADSPRVDMARAGWAPPLTDRSELVGGDAADR
jgi:alkylated DNA nucleotide flippase Atl1